MTRPVLRREVSYQLWLTVGGLFVAVALLAGLFAFRGWMDQRVNSRRDADLRRDLCGVVEAIPVPTVTPTSPAVRAWQAKMEALRETTCERGAHGEEQGEG